MNRFLVNLEPILVASLGEVREFDLTHHVVSNSFVTRDGRRSMMNSHFHHAHVERGHPGGALFTVGGIYANAL